MLHARMDFAKPTLAAMAFALLPLIAQADDQTQPGAGNAAAVQLAKASPLVQSAYALLVRNARKIRSPALRTETLDILTNEKTCLKHRANLTEAAKDAIVGQLKSAGLVDIADDATFPGGLKTGVFPAVLHDGSACPSPPQPFYAAPGSSFGSHHSQPGGLAVHEIMNDMDDLALAANYARVYGSTNRDGLPVVRMTQTGHRSDLGIDNEILLAAPIWHDFAKTMVFQWNADGSEFKELNFGGNGKTDACGPAGTAGDSRTGGHHIIGLAEAMARGLAPDFVITQASAHAPPTLGNEYKVVNWLRAAAIIAQIDPVAKGFLTQDAAGCFRLPPVRRVGEFDLLGQHQTNLLVEYVLHNLSDADFNFTVPAAGDVDLLLKKLAPEYGYDATQPNYNLKFRNPVLSYLSAERLYILYSNRGLDAVRGEIKKLKTLKLL